MVNRWLPVMLFVAAAACSPYAPIERVDGTERVVSGDVVTVAEFMRVGTFYGSREGAYPPQPRDAQGRLIPADHLAPMIYDWGVPLVEVSREGPVPFAPADEALARQAALTACARNPDWGRVKPDPVAGPVQHYVSFADGRFRFPQICQQA